MCGLPEHRGIEHTSLNSMRIAPYEIIPMIQTDSLEVALSETPCLMCRDGWLDHPVRRSACNLWIPDPPALAAAARKWIKQSVPGEVTASWALDLDENRGYNRALADVAKAVGL